ncbi:RYamide receptor-like [Oculina patagonica]
MAVTSSAAFIGNFLVIVTVYKTPNLRTSTNYYYVNMAVSDFLASLTTWPLYVTKEVTTSSGSLLQGPLATISCKGGMYFRMVSYTVSVFSLVLIAVERFIATVFPLKVTRITRKVKASLLFATWMIPLAHFTPVFYYSRLEEVGPKTLCRTGWKSLALVIYYITSAAIYIFAPLIAIIIIYSRIMHALKTRQQPELNNANSTNSQQKRSKQIRNVMKIFKSVVIVYFVCICSSGVYFVLQITLHDFQRLDKCRFIRDVSTFLLPLLSTAINPVILFSLSTNFRQALQKLCPFSLGKCRSCCHVSLQQENISLPELVTYRQTSSR